MYTNSHVGLTWRTLAKFDGRSNTCEYRTRSSIWSRINSRTSHRVVVEVAVFREATMEEEEIEEGVVQEELVEEEEAEADTTDFAPYQINGQSTRDQDQKLH